EIKPGCHAGAGRVAHPRIRGRARRGVGEGRETPSLKKEKGRLGGRPLLGVLCAWVVRLVGEPRVVLGARSALLHLDLLVLLHLLGVELLAALEAGAAVLLRGVVAEGVDVVVLHPAAAAVGALGALPVLIG